jgi:chromosome segregation ATPase
MLFGERKLPGTFEAAKDNQVNVMAAFRQLQIKARDAERAREAALREKDEVKRQIFEKNRRESLMRSRIMSNTSEKLVGIQRDNDRIRKQNEELERDLQDIAMATTALQREVVERRARIADEIEGSGEMSTRSLDVYKVERDLESEISRVHARIEELEHKTQRVRVGAAEAEARRKGDIVSVGIDLERTKASSNNSRARGNALENYMNMLLNINADLVDAVSAKEDAREQIDKFVVVPRYSWPKGIVKKATQVVTEAAAEQILQERNRAAGLQASKMKQGPGPSFGLKKEAPSSPTYKQEHRKKKKNWGAIAGSVAPAAAVRSKNKSKSKSTAPARTTSTAAPAAGFSRRLPVASMNPGYLRPKSY